MPSQDANHLAHDRADRADAPFSDDDPFSNDDYDRVHLAEVEEDERRDDHDRAMANAIEVRRQEEKRANDDYDRAMANTIEVGSEEVAAAAAGVVANTNSNNNRDIGSFGLGSLHEEVAAAAAGVVANTNSNSNRDIGSYNAPDYTMDTPSVFRGHGGDANYSGGLFGRFEGRQSSLELEDLPPLPLASVAFVVKEKKVLEKSIVFDSKSPSGMSSLEHLEEETTVQTTSIFPSSVAAAAVRRFFLGPRNGQQQEQQVQLQQQQVQVQQQQVQLQQPLRALEHMPLVTFANHQWETSSSEDELLERDEAKIVVSNSSSSKKEKKELEQLEKKKKKIEKALAALEERARVSEERGDRRGRSATRKKKEGGVRDRDSSSKNK